ncbi:Glutathione S-transferase-like protein ustS [Penicillium malachiteum]|uniref:Glutathione S-transferase-like protein ustS n=1 Tax=Penicillium malachiteum TaxID=1324776 RepID=UPI0025486560|nr:Glutathione S-transferase-like protein ustS [Penicillium malachiteum]KAJ5726360.1 Glutathione S-transferase-like protein ustS [Penicillium malachiteum]
MAESNPVHFFDIPSTLPGSSKSWSPNTLKVRTVLNFKNIPYTQSWISYPDIKPFTQGLGLEANPTGYKWTLPAIIHDSVTSNPNGAMMDSLPIVQHLDKVFPEPPLFPSGDASYALLLAVQRLTIGLGPAIRSIIIPTVPEYLDPRGQEYFVRTRSESFGKPLAEVRPTDPAEIQELWESVEKSSGPLLDVLKGREGKKGPFFEGEKAGCVDLFFVSTLAFLHRFAPDLWEKFMAFGDGEFRVLWNVCSPWLEGQGEEKEWPVPQVDA